MAVLIIDDHKLFADALRSSLAQREIEVVGVATTAEMGLDVAKATEPSLVLCDLNLPDGDGILLGRSIMDELPGTRVLALTSRKDQQTITEVVTAGLTGYLSKDTPLAQVVDTIAKVKDGQELETPTAAPPKLRATISKEWNSELLARQLTEREIEVLRLLVEGADSTTIARNLSISSSTVRTHVQSILTKLQVRSRLAAVAFAVRHGIVDVRRQDVRRYA
jgi:two-component system, NarL family, nitrate/nitrite response regulator NarL